MTETPITILYTFASGSSNDKIRQFRILYVGPASAAPEYYAEDSGGFYREYWSGFPADFVPAVSAVLIHPEVSIPGERKLTCTITKHNVPMFSSFEEIVEAVETKTIKPRAK